jgi:hypothetical protein
MSTKLMIICIATIFMCRFFYYCQNNLANIYCDYLKQNSELHAQLSRNSTKLHVNFQRTNYCKYTVFNKKVSMELSQWK